MPLLWLLLLLLLPLLAVLWQQRSPGARPRWLISLQHRVAWWVLGWAAAWQQRKLERGTLNVGQSQQQALVWCLKKAQGSCWLPTENTGVFLAPGGGGPVRENNPRDSQVLEPKGPFVCHRYDVACTPLLLGCTPLLGPALAFTSLPRPFLGSFPKAFHSLLTS